jgi:hypothetical protein
MIGYIICMDMVFCSSALRTTLAATKKPPNSTVTCSLVKDIWAQNENFGTNIHKLLYCKT